MSHFTVLVIGNNPEEQLEKYNENTEVPEYKTEDGYSTYNPDSKWDWYTLGGRWRGFFKLKREDNVYSLSGKVTVGNPGAFDNEKKYDVDQCLKRDVDIEGMRQDSIEKAAETYDKAMAIFGSSPVNKTFEQIREEIGEGNINLVRETYWNQPRCKTWEAANCSKQFGFFSTPDKFIVSREEYLENARNSALSTYALVKDGKWYQKGEMGWWGMSSDEMGQEEWNRFFNNLLDELSDDTLLSLFDCHI